MAIEVELTPTESSVVIMVRGGFAADSVQMQQAGAEAGVAPPADTSLAEMSALIRALDAQEEEDDDEIQFKAEPPILTPESPAHAWTFRMTARTCRDPKRQLSPQEMATQIAEEFTALGFAVVGEWSPDSTAH